MVDVADPRVRPRSIRYLFVAAAAARVLAAVAPTGFKLIALAVYCDGVASNDPDLGPEYHLEPGDPDWARQSESLIDQTGYPDERPDWEREANRTRW